jgi:hypothetical protein
MVQSALLVRFGGWRASGIPPAGRHADHLLEAVMQPLRTLTADRRMVAFSAAVLAVVAAMSAALLVVPTSADAQPATEVVVVSDIPVTPVNGHAAILLGSDDGVISIHCDGGSGPNRELGGPVVPAIVLDRLDPDATRLRITTWGTNTPAVNGQTVFIGCTFETEVATVPALRSLSRPAGRGLLYSGRLPA